MVRSLCFFPGRQTVGAKKKASVKRAAGEPEAPASETGRARGLPREGRTRGAKALKTKPEDCQDFAKEELAAAWPAIVKGFVQQAKQGSLNHAKFIVDFSGLKEERKNVTQPTRLSLSERLMQSLERYEMAEKDRGGADGLAKADFADREIEQGGVREASKEERGEE